MEQDTDGVGSFDELLKCLREQVQRGAIDVDLPAKSLRLWWQITDAVTDEQIEQAITEAFRYPGPNLVVTLCGGTIVAEVALFENTEVEDAITDLEDHLSWTYGGDVSISKASNNASGYGILIAYRMPPRFYRPYKAGDEHLIDRFGMEIGRYSQRRIGRAA
ncbi:hypothetical protein [Aurantimonas coralicida]|uniref:hypothetical protein n=1 Tax=Aurantimonas coralicida TaxID=182270 RepID=UPI002387DAF7|nr:hypothetical protein [Aurantimonas coralicida]MDE0924783.1 hypothetical protein [Aurantimonas coralicida]|tara:strand:- start:88 stop:573 length:486 start_codon:yes stop_codon:yes gene_type:complete